jgi:rhomboid protease GluP
MLRSFGNDLGFVSLVLYGCLTLYFGSLLVTMMFGENIVGSGNPLSILSPSPQVLFVLGGSGAVPVFYAGHWWTILSASWLHGSALHILFNMLWVRQLGPPTADIYGPGRMIIIYTIAGAVGFALSSVMGVLLPGIPFIGGARLTVGASASIFGLLGALVYYGRRGGSSMIRSEAMGYASTLFIMGFILPGVDNYAHAGGFVGGYVAGMWLDPLKPERMDHLVGAVLSLVATLVAILASVVPFFLR